MLVLPEYNHSFPGLLKHVLDSNFKRIHHPQSGRNLRRFRRRFWRHARDLEFAAGLAQAWFDEHFLGREFLESFRGLFDENGQIKDPAYPGRIDEFLKEVIWV